MAELARPGFRDYDTARRAEDLKVEALLRAAVTLNAEPDFH
ncbi:MAG: hypothetical protein ABSE28_19085 [Candidatus Sulfotelmatobacter sp.]